MSYFDFVPGEEVLLKATLRKDKWMRYRCATCTMKCVSTVYFAPILVPIYALFGGPCRQEEADSFELVLTNQNIHFRQLLYNCGICCQQSGTKVIPLEKIQDIALVSDCLGDTCGVVDTKGEIYQLHVQTAAMGGMMPELCVYCIDNPREFKRKVMDAKNRLATGGAMNSVIGQGKAGGAGAQGQSEDVARILGLLERQMQGQQGQAGYQAKATAPSAYHSEDP